MLERGVVDAGRKAINGDMQMPLVKTLPDSQVVKLSAEHGWLALGPQSYDVKIGDKIELIVGYADLTTVLYDEFHVFRGDRARSGLARCGSGHGAVRRIACNHHGFACDMSNSGDEPTIEMPTPDEARLFEFLERYLDSVHSGDLVSRSVLIERHPELAQIRSLHRAARSTGS